MFLRKRHLNLLFITALLMISFIAITRFEPREENIYKNITSSIDEKNIRNMVDELTSEKYNGRLIGTEGNKLATSYIVTEFKKMGLTNPVPLKGYEQPYRQNVRFTNKAPELKILDDRSQVEKKYKYIEDFSVITHNPSLNIKADIKAKSVILNSIKELNKDKTKFKDRIILVPKSLAKDNGLRNIILNIMENELGTSAVAVEVNIKKKNNGTFPVAPNASPVDSFDKNGPMVFTVEPDSFKELTEYSKENKEIHMKADYSIENVTGSNVIGVIEGTEEGSKDEHIIIGAHFDHVGDNKDGGYNPGALDNASGTASMIEIAKVIMENKIPPKKTVVFIAFNGEEEGLYGSYHYTENPILPLNNKTIMINLDMVGSKRKIPLDVISYDGKTTKLRDEFLKLGRELNLEVKSGVNQASDHAPFAAKGIDSVCLINMDLESGYHTPNDTSDKVDAKKSKEISELVLYYLDKNIY